MGIPSADPKVRRGRLHSSLPDHVPDPWSSHATARDGPGSVRRPGAHQAVSQPLPGKISNQFSHIITAQDILLILLYSFSQGLTGVGFAMCASCLVLCLTNLAVITWSCQALYTLFNDQVWSLPSINLN